MVLVCEMMLRNQPPYSRPGSSRDEVADTFAGSIAQWLESRRKIRYPLEQPSKARLSISTRNPTKLYSDMATASGLNELLSGCGCQRNVCTEAMFALLSHGTFSSLWNLSRCAVRLFGTFGESRIMEKVYIPLLVPMHVSALRKRPPIDGPTQLGAQVSLSYR